MKIDLLLMFLYLLKWNILGGSKQIWDGGDILSARTYDFGHHKEIDE